jgi:hypothetical protein
MNKTVSTIIGLTMTLAMAGISFAAQTTPAPAPKAASSATAVKSTKKAKHVKSTAKAKGTAKAASKTTAAPAK